MDLSPEVVRVRREGAIVETLPADVVLGETAIVRPGERFPLDGVVSNGASAADESAITGESVPVDKVTGDRVFAGSLNTIGLLEVTVTAPASDSTLARIVYLVEEAAASKAPAQLLVDRFSRYYTPAVVALAVAVWVVPVVATGSVNDPASWSLWLSRALVVLVTACPCALVISTPVAMVSAISRASRAGVLVKGGAFLELAASTRAVAFDKTGTLTTGRLHVVRAHAVEGHDPIELLRTAASLEAHSTHPLARAVVDDARGRHLTFESVTELSELPGRGVSGTVSGRRAALVSPSFAEEIASVSDDLAALVTAAENDGLTVLVLVESGVAAGFLGVADRWRQESKQVVAALHAMGIEHTSMLTGDNERTAAAVAGQAGVSAFQARLLPHDKVDAVDRLQGRYGVVAMVGDGVNDAPALATADIGIAMGAAGSDTALETADVALLSDDLAALPGFFALGRSTLRNRSAERRVLTRYQVRGPDRRRAGTCEHVARRLCRHRRGVAGHSELHATVGRNLGRNATDEGEVRGVDRERGPSCLTTRTSCDSLRAGRWCTRPPMRAGRPPSPAASHRNPVIWTPDPRRSSMGSRRSSRRARSSSKPSWPQVAKAVARTGRRSRTASMRSGSRWQSCAVRFESMQATLDAILERIPGPADGSTTGKA